MSDHASTETTQTLADRIAIEDVLARYCRGIDRCDAEELEQVFTEDALIDYGDGPKPREETIAGLMEGLGAMRLTHHNIGNVICRIAGDRAKTETYCVALHILPSDASPDHEGDIEMVVGGRYLDTLIKVENALGAHEWRIAERLYIMDWNRQGPATMQISGGLYDTLSRRGKRQPDDPSCDWWAKGV
ncbi:MAG: nuclear transport factor 2 family protein [Pseudomonadota bacterium]